MKLREDHDAVAAAPGPTGPAPTVFEAVVRRRCVTATYNRTEVLLAPHAVWTRHGDLFVDAITVTLNGKGPRETKLGTFKLIGLGDLALTDEPFIAHELFDPADAKYAGELLLSVDRE